VAGAQIIGIEFYVGATRVGSGAGATWSVVEPGTYALTARAYDDHGGIGTSAPVNVTIMGDPNTKITFIHNDFAGNPIAATDLTGAVMWKESYTPFGQRLQNASASSSSRQWFGGKPADSESGLSYFGARYYDPAVGRFMGMDSAGFYGDNTHSFNRFIYANNNPYRFVDRDGHFTLLEGAVVVGITGLVVISTCEPCKEAMSKPLRAAMSGLQNIFNESAGEGEKEAEKTENDGRGEAGKIDRGKQDKHIPGTSEHKTGGEGKSTWADPTEADKLTEQARVEGQVVRIRPDGSSVIKWDAGRVVGAQGQTQVTVHVQPTGGHHGHPSGPTSGGSDEGNQ
jgi:RHS repeat-associated protein